MECDELVNVLCDIRDEMKLNREELRRIADKLEKIYYGMP